MTTQTTSKTARRILAVLAALTALGVVLQGVWAGIFLSSDKRPDAWVHIHDIGAWATLILAALTAVWALVFLRRQLLLVVGSILLVALVAGEAHLGGMITDDGNDAMTAVHIPLAMALLALAVWLPVYALRGRRPLGQRPDTE
ncbi:hypothetical protein [Leifsonia sp. AG29]|uniref:hypothetical protein n=1 Tax=Leifsonia sp. AG29 TaxID=2598860 RepID=UPI00131E2656|nr:hypothetical protein [Leifsonia sp. AG29]